MFSKEINTQQHNSLTIAKSNIKIKPSGYLQQVLVKLESTISNEVMIGDIKI